MSVVYYTPDPIALLFVSIAGGVLALDRVTVRSMLSSPLVAAPLIAALLGMPLLGMLTGLLFQLFWVREPDAPTKTTPDSGFGAAIASAVSASLVGHLSFGERLLTLWPYAMIFGVLVSPLAGFTRWLVIRDLSRRLSKFDAAVRAGDLGAIRRYMAYGVVAHGFAGAFAAGLTYMLGYAGWHFFQNIWYEADPVLLTIIPLFAGIAISSVAKIFLQRDTLLAFVGGAMILTGFELLRRFVTL